MADVFPPRNLPGRAEDWGRQVERRIESGESSEVQLEQKVDNGLRATGGQLATISNQLNELFERSPRMIEMTDPLHLTASNSVDASCLQYTVIETTQPRYLEISAWFYVDGFISASGAGRGYVYPRLAYFTSPPLPDWSNAVYLNWGLQVSQGAALEASGGGGYEDLVNRTLSYTGRLRLLPGVYAIAPALEVESTNLNVSVKATVTPGEAVMSAQASAPSDLITVSDIPEYTP